MPDNHDWVPVGVIIGFLALALWHHHDHKDKDDDDRKEDRVIQTIASRFYRQDPYIVFDIPIRGQRRTVTHFSRGPPSATNQPVPISQLPVVLTNEYQGELPAINAIAFVEIVNGRLRLWKPINKTDSWRSDLLWFNSLNLQLWNVSGTNGTNRFRIANVFNDVPSIPADGGISPQPRMVDLIYDENIPISVPYDLTAELPLWPAEFDFGLISTWNTDGSLDMGFLPPARLSFQPAINYEGYRVALGLTPTVILPNATFSNPDPITGRVTARFGVPATGGSVADVFLLKLVRGNLNGHQVGQIVYTKCLSEPTPPDCLQLLCNMFPDACEEFKARR
jgi:hypothetical protein